jgi:hypothetical protein
MGALRNFANILISSDDDEQIPCGRDLLGCAQNP